MKNKEKIKEVKPKWEIKNRLYELSTSETPIVYMLKSKIFYGLMKKKGTKENLNIVKIKKQYLRMK